MARLGMTRFAVLGVLSLGLASTVFSACSDDSNPSPDDAGSGTGGKSGGTGGSKGDGTGGKGAGGSEAGGSSGDASVGGDGGGTTDSGAGGTEPGTDSGAGGGGTVDSGTACVQDPKQTCRTCFITQIDFLNHCTDSKCKAFDNTKLAKLVNGKLPALP